MFNTLEQLFSTIGSWRPTKQNITQLSDPYITIIVQNIVFSTQKWVATQLLGNTALDQWFST